MTLLKFGVQSRGLPLHSRQVATEPLSNRCRIVVQHVCRRGLLAKSVKQFGRVLTDEIAKYCDDSAIPHKIYCNTQVIVRNFRLLPKSCESCVGTLG